jgi:uncharacterized protein YjbJ (UPF0337 family)
MRFFNGMRGTRRKSLKRRGLLLAQRLHLSGLPTGRMAVHLTKEHSMNWDRIQGNWKQMTGKVKEQWGKLTDDEIDQIGGKREQLAGKLQESYGITKDEAEQQIDSFENRYGDAASGDVNVRH